MATVLRVKRKNCVPHQDALILCKRMKLSDDSEDEAACSDLVPTVAKFAGTLKDPEENVLQHLAKNLSKEELRTSFKQPPLVNFLTQRRKETKDRSAENRYKVINCNRSLDTSNIEQFEDKVMTFVDLEDSVSLAASKSTEAAAAAAAMEKEDEEKNCNYVYDLYYVENYDSIEDCISIHPYEHELVYDAPTEDGYQSDHDSEDSNAESYYQNSYPSTDCSDNSIQENYMKATIRDLELCHLSNEDDSENSNDENDVYALDMRDVETYGYKYARYKQRMKPLLNGDLDDDVEDSNINTSSSDSSE